MTEESLSAQTEPVEGPGWPPEAARFPVRECLLIILSEEWEHRRYAERDLDTLESARRRGDPESGSVRGSARWCSGDPVTHAWGMSSVYEHPSLQLYVTPDQRDRAESWLKEAYADGRVSESEFDQRIGQVLSATRKELNEAFYGLVQGLPTRPRALGVHPAYQPLVRPETREQAGRGAAGFAHFSLFFIWLFGPAWSTPSRRPARTPGARRPRRSTST